MLAEIEALGKRRHVDPYEVALMYIGLGRADNAFRALDRAVDAKSGMVVFAKVDPKLNSLRSDRRFAQILGKLRLQ